MADAIDTKLAAQAADSLTQLLRDAFVHPAWDMWEFHADDYVAWKKHYVLGKGCSCEGK